MLYMYIPPLCSEEGKSMGKENVCIMFSYIMCRQSLYRPMTEGGRKKRGRKQGRRKGSLCVVFSLSSIILLCKQRGKMTMYWHPPSMPDLPSSLALLYLSICISINSMVVEVNRNMYMKKE